MTRKLVIVTSALLLGAGALAAMPGQADDRPAVAADVPLPVSRPIPLGRPAAGMPPGAEPSARLLADGAGAGASAGEAPKPDGSGLKSGSSEALAVQLEGAKVVSAEGRVVGEVERIVERPGGGRQAVVGIGGFLGIGESRVLVPAGALSPSGKRMVRADLTEAQIRELPAYRE